jgi:hypothetical protein
MDMRFVLILLIGLPMGLAVVLVAQRAGAGQKQAMAARRWPQATAVVISSGVQEEWVRTRRYSSHRYSPTRRYGAQVVVEYEVDGRRYHSKRLHLGERMLASTPDSAEKTAARYPAGSTVTVFYNPANPTDATLQPVVGGGTWVWWGTAALLALITLAIIMLILSSPPIRF